MQYLHNRPSCRILAGLSCALLLAASGCGSAGTPARKGTLPATAYESSPGGENAETGGFSTISEEDVPAAEVFPEENTSGEVYDAVRSEQHSAPVEILLPGVPPADDPVSAETAVSYADEETTETASEEKEADAAQLSENTSKARPDKASLYRENTDGTPASGWVTDEDGSVGYCGENGYLLTGFQVLDGSRYYFTEEGDRVSGIYTLENGERVLFTEDGRQYLNSVAEMDGAMYFFGPDGYITVGADIPLPGGGTGMTDAEGRLYTGCHRFGDEVYTFTSHGRFRHKINANTPMVALTYDDGPSEQNTPVILETLRTCGGHATFFVCGRNVERCSAIIQEIEDSGSEVANHTFNHYMVVNMDAPVTFQEISSTSSFVQMITGNRPSIMRPPTGATNEASRANVAAVDNGYPLIIWSLDTIDWQHHDAATTIDRVLTQVKDGSIVLMHDMEASSAEASKTLIPELIARGYQLVSVSELAAARGIRMEPGKEYNHFYPEEALPVSESLPDYGAAADIQQP